MGIRRRIDAADGAAALVRWALWADADPVPEPLPRPVLAMAVRFTLEELAERAEGNSVEVRVPPFGVTQCIPGPRHTRGTPPNVVELAPAVWLALATGRADWAAESAAGRVSASGLRADLSALLPLFGTL
ncbi:sterol carrier family protein [Paeniglutamicibacter cryotolerans]|uniref:Bacterial SCP orthologue domain-containing protein n=1 Tax=Paeniglutamicibacter cryotolerans TaxID=670079 RepID=A0A839QM34_9MICC|nr:sterol carrier family protein [Paeniglutamicibacter cryotolerans]MBB2994262.1 hypothetical protein [Paeniglutamicibacter cryotolerans]